LLGILITKINLITAKRKKGCPNTFQWPALKSRPFFYTDKNNPPLRVQIPYNKTHYPPENKMPSIFQSTATIIVLVLCGFFYWLLTDQQEDQKIQTASEDCMVTAKNIPQSQRQEFEKVCVAHRLKVK
jgi:hypothetical protein